MLSREDKDILYKCLVGMAVGEALVISTNDKLETLEYGNSRHSREWGCNTALTLATIDALNEFNWTIDNTDKYLMKLLDNFKEWYLDARFTSNNHSFDVDKVHEESIKAWIMDRINVTDGVKAYGITDDTIGNYVIARMLPLIFIKDKKVMSATCNTIHNNEKYNKISLAYIEMLKQLNKTKDKSVAYKAVLKKLKIQNLDEELLVCKGDALDTFKASLWCLMTTNNYNDCILKAVNFNGLDKNKVTISAIAGALAGALYGIGGDLGIDWKLVHNLKNETALRSICFNN